MTREAAALAARWAAQERQAGRAVTVAMERRVSGSVRRGWTPGTPPATVWARIEAWSAAVNLQGCRPPTTVLTGIVRDGSGWWAR